MIRRFAALLALLTLFTATPAYAGPFAALIPIVIGAVVKTVALKIALTIAATIAVSMLEKALKKKPRPPGIMIESTRQGGTNDRTIIVGLYATSGSEPAPPMSWGTANKTPNFNFVKIISFADVPVDGLSRVIINGEYIPLVSTGGNSYNLGGKYAGYGQVRFYDGRQTTADAGLVSVLATYPNRPWTSARVGYGVSYGVFIFQYNPDLYKGEPTVRAEIRGMRFYDRRKDSTAGGSGAHRWNNKATWEYTTNNIVIVENILRGIELEDGTIFGPGCTTEELPLLNWVAAMNVCDEDITIGGGGTEKRFRAGFEFSVNDEPADVIEELLKGCSGQIFEMAGTYKVRVGPPALPVMFITDDDFLVTKDQELDPFPAINTSKNIVNATFPHPEELWGQHDAPQLRNQDYIERDGQELPADLQFPACPYPRQVQRNMSAWLEDDQRHRRHTGTLDHRAFALEPLDTVAWTSARNQYDEKLFEVGLAVKSLYTLVTGVALREVDPNDYHWESDFELPDPVAPGGWDLPEQQAVPGFAVLSWTIKDDVNGIRRPAIRCGWDADGALDATALRIEVRVAATDEAVTAVTVSALANGEQIISEGILPATSYEVRAQYQVDRPTIWTSWIGVTTADIRFGNKDLNFDEMLQELGPSILLPSITRPGRNNTIQQIIDAAYNDHAVRTAAQLQDDAFEGVMGNVAAIRNESLVRLTADEAIVSTLNIQIARIDGNTSGLAQEIVNRADADSALATDISTLFTESGDNAAAITAEALARTDADTALAGSITTVTARLNNATGPGSGVTVESALTAQASDITGLQGEYTLRINVNGRVSGFGLANGSSGSEFSILADRFIVVDPANNSTTGYPFQVVGGAVYIRKAFIQTITADQITTGSFITLSAQIDNGIITTAKIGDLQVDTIKIANNALTVPFHTAGSSTFVSAGGGEQLLVETSVLNIGTVGATAMCSVGFYATARTSTTAGFGPDAACDIKMYVDHQDGSGYVIMGAQAVGVDVASGSAYFWIPVSMIDMETNVVDAKFKVTATPAVGPNGAEAKGILIGAPTIIVQGAKK